MERCSKTIDWINQNYKRIYFKMKNETQTLFAIYKNEIHLGNEKAENINAAIRKYLIAALFEESLNDKEFVSLYSGKKAIQGIHFL
jgi:hypothetical protein